MLKIYIVIVTSFIFIGCQKNYTDPSRIPDTEVFSTPKGLTGVAIGLQRIYTVGRASSLYNSITINGLLTNEMFVVNAGNAAEVQLQTGGASVDATHTMLTTYWINNNKIIYDANLVIANAGKLDDKKYASGLIAYASIFKALSIGNMAMYWEKIPDTIGTNVKFITRVDGFKKAIQVLDNALAATNANPISTAFIANIPAGIDIVNTLYALKARYALFSGDYTIASTAANAVDLTKKSTFNFDVLTFNPVFETATSTNNVVQVKDSTLGLLGSLRPALTDGRVLFYTSIDTTAPRFRIKGFGAANTTPIPVYLPGEITLIKAEIYARQNDLTNALTELNKVVIKTSDPFGVAANQPALPSTLTQAEILDQIYRNRCIELYMSGLKLEDMRRFGRQVVPPNSESKRNFMPYPFRERDNNPNTPPNPAF